MKTSEEYKLIPMSEITDEARRIAVAWMACEDKDWIGQKHKLASDIMNYAKKQVAEATKDCYPKEFVEWMFQDCPFIIGENGAGNIIAFSIRDSKQFTFNELFDYWTKNIK